MKDYSFGKNKNFILNYEIIDENIFIKYANRVKTVKYSEKKEKELLEQIKKQRTIQHEMPIISYKKDELIKTLEDLRKYKTFSYINIVFALIASPFSLTHCALYMGMAMSFGFVAISKARNKKSIEREIKEVILDIDKNNLFIENEENINENIKNEIIYETLNPEVKKHIDKEKGFDLNNIEYLDLEQLHELLETIEILKEFESIDQEDPEEDPNPKKLVKNKTQV